jgi:hypothetical protein
MVTPVVSLSYPHWPLMHNHEAIHQLHCLLGYRLPHRMYLLSCWRVSVRKQFHNILSILDDYCDEDDKDDDEIYIVHTTVQHDETKPGTSSRQTFAPAQGWTAPAKGYIKHPGHGSMNWSFGYEDGCLDTDRVKKGPRIGRGHLEGGGSLRWEPMSSSLF